MRVTSKRIQAIKTAVLSVAMVIAVVGETVALEAARIADGQPWAMTASRGPNGSIVLNADGTGKMKAMGMNMNVKWQANGDELCLTTRMRGTRCVTLVASNTGYTGVEEGKVAFTLAR